MKLAIVSDNLYSKGATTGGDDVPGGANQTDDPQPFLALGYFYMDEFFPLLRPRFTGLLMAGLAKDPAPGENWTAVAAKPWLRVCGLPDFKGIAGWFLRLPAIARALYQVISEADVVLLKVFSLNSILALPIARFLGKKIMCQIVGDPVDAFTVKAASWPAPLRHSGKFLIERSTRSIVAASSLVWTVSRALADRYVPRGKPFVVASESRMKLEDYRERIELHGPENDRPLRLIFVGRLEKVKGLDTLLTAMEILKAEEIRLTIVGDGSLNSWLEAELAGRGLTDRIDLAGPVPFGSRLFDLYRSADVMVLPSYSEGLPLVLVEAMANSLPVVATAVGGIPEIVEHEKNGLLVPPGKPSDLAEAIRCLAVSPDLRARLASASYATALERSAERERAKAARAILEIFNPPPVATLDQQGGSDST